MLKNRFNVEGWNCQTLEEAIEHAKKILLQSNRNPSHVYIAEIVRVVQRELMPLVVARVQGEPAGQKYDEAMIQAAGRSDHSGGSSGQ